MFINEQVVGYWLGQLASQARKSVSVTFITIMVMPLPLSVILIGFTGEKTSLMLVNHFKTFKAMQDFDLNKVLEIDGATTRNKHHIVKALNAIKEDVDLKEIKLNWELISIFTDRSKLTEKQEREFEKLKQDLLSWEPSGGISEDLEMYLYEIGEASLMDDLAWGV